MLHNRRMANALTEAPRRRLPPAERKANLAQAALEVAAAQGYANLSLDDVASRAGVTRNLLYHYFPRGRLDVFLAALGRAGEELTGDWLTDADRPLDEKLEANFLRYVDAAEQPTDAWRVLLHARATADPEIERLRNGYRDAAVASIALNHLGTDDPPPLALIALRGFVDYAETALDEWRGTDLDREAVLGLLSRTLVATVAAARDMPSMARPGRAVD
jgi:AcrR family transcriptional regulator